MDAAAAPSDIAPEPSAAALGESVSPSATRYAARLTRPDGTPGTVWLLARHDDPAASDPAALIRAVQPAKVVLGLDRESFEAAQKWRQRDSALLARHRVPYLHLSGLALLKMGDGAFGILTLAAQGHLLAYAAQMALTLNEAVAGEMLDQHFAGVIAAAEDASKDEESEEAQREAATSLSEFLQRRMSPAANAAVQAAQRQSRAQHGCMEPFKTQEAARRLIVEAAVFGAVRSENLLAVRACMTSSKDIHRDVDAIMAAPAVSAAGGTPPLVAAAAARSRDPGEVNTSAMMRTVCGERELLFARALQAPSDGRDVVGVFSSGHMAGIARAWAGARSAESDALSAEFMRPVPSGAAPSHVSFPTSTAVSAAALGVAGLALRRAYKSARPLRNTALVLTAVAAVPVAAGALAERALLGLYRADAEARALRGARQRAL